MIGRYPYLVAGRRKLRNAVIRFRHVSPMRLVADLCRARRLRNAVPAMRAVPSRPERLVVSLTSIPERAGALRPVLHSLLDQSSPADRIVLTWPRTSLRTAKPYPPPPPVPRGVEVARCEDLGPATKLLPTLRAEPDALIVVVDDDVVYPHDFLETLLAAHRANPTSAVGYRGWRLVDGLATWELDHEFATARREPVSVDILFGTWGYLLPPHALDLAVYDFDGWPPEVRWVDDVWVSGHLARCGVPRLVVPARGLPLETSASNVAALTFSLNRSGHNDRIAIEAFAKWW